MAPATPGRPSLALRLAAFVILSRWALKRVRHPALRAALANLARQTGRADLARELEG